MKTNKPGKGRENKRSGRPDRPGRSDAKGRPERTGRPGGRSRQEGSGRPERPGGRSRQESSGKSGRPGGTGRGRDERPDRKPYPARRSQSGSKQRPAAGKGREESLVRLNKFIANAGVCSRREADVLITTGAIKVNGEVVTTLGTKIKPGDVVHYGDQKLSNEKKVYVLLNKPKDYISTADDPQERKTVLHLIGNAFRERLYPVGRLDRNTTGLLLLTNDGELTKKLTHPKHGVRKIYQVQLDKSIPRNDLEQIASGVQLGDEKVVPDNISYTTPQNKQEIGIELHSGQNRVVRRIFEQFGYKVTKLDRVVFAGLTKKDLPRGKWRQLTEKEVAFLKMQG